MTGRSPSRSQRWALAAIDWYQQAAVGRLSPCRFYPSCSSYARESFEVHGTRRGAWLTVRRLARCRPFGSSGYDPVPSPPIDRCDELRQDTDAAVSDSPFVHKDC